MSKPKRAKTKRPMQPRAAAQQLWGHVKQQFKLDETLAALVPEDASQSAFKVKKSVD